MQLYSSGSGYCSVYYPQVWSTPAEATCFPMGKCLLWGARSGSSDLKEFFGLGQEWGGIPSTSICRLKWEMISEWPVAGTGSFPPLPYTQLLFTALSLWLVFWDENTQQWNTMVDLLGWDTNKSYVANQVEAAAGRYRHRLEACHSIWFGLCTNSSLNDAPSNLLATWDPHLDQGA